jgi:hypothetical protein
MANPNNNQGKVINGPISEATVNKIIEMEGQRIQLAIQKTASRDKEIDANTKIAERSIDAQAEYLKSKPKQDRLTYLTIGGIIAFFFVASLVFLCYLLNTGNKDLAKYILLGLSHFATGALGYYAKGKRNGNADTGSTDNIQDAEVVND